VPSTLRWTAPELLAQPDAEETRFSEVLSTACDVYSFAMVLCELATFADPFDHVADDAQVSRLYAQEIMPPDIGCSHGQLGRASVFRHSSHFI